MVCRNIYKAVDFILKQHYTLFESIIKYLDEYPELESIAETILLCGQRVIYNINKREKDFPSKTENEKPVLLSNGDKKNAVTVNIISKKE